MPVVEVFADVRCPFTHVGLRRLVERREAEGLDFVLHVRAWPLELVNGAPLDPVLIGREIEALQEQVAPELFAGFSVPAFAPTSLPALDLVAAAYAAGVEAGEQVALDLRWAMFEEGADIAGEELLAATAERFGVAPGGGPWRERVVADWDEGRERGVIGSPHFFVAGRSLFCPVLHITHEGDRLRVAENRPAFDDLLDAAVAG